MNMSNSTGRLRGSMTAMVTPFRNGEVDWSSLSALVDQQISGGTDWLVLLGTTGETPTLSPAERARIVESVRSECAGRAPVMVGTGSNNTAEAVEQTRQAKHAGADAALVVAPPYNRPTQEGLFRHFAAVAEAAEIPIVLYNVPARTGVRIETDTVVRVRERFDNIVAIKDATGAVDHVTDLRNRSDIAILCGDDALTWPMMALGAVGVISVLSNLCPWLMKSLVSAALAGNVDEALPRHATVFDLASGLGRFGPNPVPIKTAMALSGMLAEEFRLPLCPLDSEARGGIERLLLRHDLLERVPA